MVLGGICMSKFIIGDLIKEAAEAYEAGNYLNQKIFIKSYMVYINVK